MAAGREQAGWIELRAVRRDDGSDNVLFAGSTRAGWHAVDKDILGLDELS